MLRRHNFDKFVRRSNPSAHQVAMNRTLLNLLTWGTIASAVVCALLLAAAVDDLDPGARPAAARPSAGRVDPAAPRTLAAQAAPAPPEASPVRLAERN